MYASTIQQTFLSNMARKWSLGQKWESDFVSGAPFEVNDKKFISDENVNAITCEFPCKILKKFTLAGSASSSLVFLCLFAVAQLEL